MMRELRKRHLQVWRIWALLIPAGIITSWLAIPNQVPAKLLQQSQSPLLPDIYSAVDKPAYTAILRSDDSHQQWQLEWQHKQPLQTPSALLCWWPGSVEKLSTLQLPDQTTIIGRIEAKGDYRFPVEADSSFSPQGWLVLYDFIHEKIIDTLYFKTEPNRSNLQIP